MASLHKTPQIFVTYAYCSVNIYIAECARVYYYGPVLGLEYDVQIVFTFLLTSSNAIIVVFTGRIKFAFFLFVCRELPFRQATN